MPKKSKKLRKNIMISPEIDLRVKEAAGKYKTSESAIVESAVKRWLDEDNGKQLPPFFEYAGAFDCQSTDLAKAYKTKKSKRRR